MLFSLEAVNAKEGDALLLHYGDPDDPEIVMIDGGARGVYNQTFKGRLEEIQELLELDGPVPLRLVMVSHIDGDHIAGVIDMFKAAERALDDGDDPLIETDVLWHNSFDDILGNSQIAGVASFGAALDSGRLDRDGFAQDPHSIAMIAGVGQGRTLRDLAGRLSLAVNSPFSRFVQTRSKPIKLGSGLEFRVLGPSRDQLDDLEEKWDKEVKKMQTASLAERRKAIASFTDKSVANLSSIVVHAKLGNRTMLLTGDARGDFILEALDDAGMLKNGKVKVDLLKVPHHGSSNNVTTRFFRKVLADHYIFSADGKHDNPDKETLEMLTTARGSARYTMYFTNAVPHVDRFLEQDRQDHNRKYDVFYRDDDYFSVWCDLGSALVY